MAAGLVSQHQQSSFATPINGAAGDATVVLGNDNATVTSYNAHDADSTIHVQSSSAATFAATPAATLGRKWMTNDTGAVYLYYDTGSVWVEANYLRNNTATFTVKLISTTALATPSALAATTFSAFASTVSGAAIMGYGTTNDVSLMNRAGTVVLGIGPNTTVVNIPGTLLVTGLSTLTAGFSAGAASVITSASATALTVGRQGATAPAFAVHSSTASQVSGVQITGKDAGGGLSKAVIIEAISSDAEADLIIRNKGTGYIYFGLTGGGIQWNPTAIAAGGGATATLGTVGGSGPASATFRRWIPIYENDGNLSFFPVWR